MITCSSHGLDIALINGIYLVYLLVLKYKMGKGVLYNVVGTVSNSFIAV
jgi:hypothetical protein